MRIECVVQVRVTSGKGGGDQPPPSHAWTSFLIADMFQDDIEEWITEAVVLAPGEAILFFGKWSLNEGLPLGDARDVGFCLAGLVNRARREAQVETMISTVQEGHWAFANAIMEKRTKARGPGCPWGTTNTNQTPTAAYNIEVWMQGLEEDASEVEVRNGNVSNHGTEQRNIHSQHVDRGRGGCRRQGTPQLPRDTSGGSPFSGGSTDQGSDWSSHQSTMMRGSREGNWAGRAGRGLKVKVNLPIFKDEKIKDAVTYCSWQWDIAIFHSPGWDD